MINMKKLLSLLFSSVFFILCFLIGFVVMGSIDWQLGLAMWIAFLCIFIWFSRNDEDGIYRTLKDTHQSNLDDIERQELEEQEVEVIK